MRLLTRTSSEAENRAHAKFFSLGRHACLHPEYVGLLRCSFNGALTNVA